MTIQLRGDTAANWTGANPVLAARQVGLETDTQRFKVGDGSTAWASLPYWHGGAAWGSITGTLSAQTDLQAALDGKQAAGSYQPLAAVLTGTTASFTVAYETKLAGIATGATANQTDTYLLSMANHTGTLAVTQGGTGATALTAGYLLQGNGTSAVSASAVSINATGLGIGTSSAAAEVDLRSSGPIVRLTDTDSAYGYHQIRASNSTILIEADNGNTAASSAIIFRVDGSEVGRFAASGGGFQPVTAIGVPYGGTGAATLTGYVKGNGVSAFTASATIPGSDLVDASVTNAKLADMATARFKGRTTAGTGAPEDLTGTQATALLDTFTSGAKGLAPASGGGTAKFLRADGTWTAPPASGWTVVKKTAIETRNSTITLTNDAALTMALGTGSWVVRGVVYFQTANATMDFKFQVNFTGTHTVSWSMRRSMGAGGVAGTDQENSFASAVAIPSTPVATTTFGIGRVEFEIYLNATTSGNLEFLWAQNTSDAGNCSVLPGSYLEYLAF